VATWDGSAPVNAKKSVNASNMPDDSKLQATLEVLRTNIKRFLQLQYPTGSKESSSTGDDIDLSFNNHVQKMESELTFDLNL
jgi:hypothetical protein